MDDRLTRMVHAVCKAGCIDGPDGRGDIQAGVAAAVAGGLLVPDPELHPAARAEARWVRARRRAGRAGKVLGNLARGQTGGRGSSDSNRPGILRRNRWCFFLISLVALFNMPLPVATWSCGASSWISNCYEL